MAADAIRWTQEPLSLAYLVVGGWGKTERKRVLVEEISAAARREEAELDAVRVVGRLSPHTLSVFAPKEGV